MRSINASSLMLQMAKAAEIEMRILTKLKDMEVRGIVRNDSIDGWLVLDQQRYAQEMGMCAPETTDENR
jgi:hypothetical protein